MLASPKYPKTMTLRTKLEAFAYLLLKLLDQTIVKLYRPPTLDANQMVMMLVAGNMLIHFP